MPSYPHAASISARRSLTYHHRNMPRDPVSASAPPLVDPHTARDPIPFACGLAFDDTWFLVSVLGFGFGRLGSMFPCRVPCYLRLLSTLLGRGSRHPWHPNVRRPFLKINYQKTVSIAHCPSEHRLVQCAVGSFTRAPRKACPWCPAASQPVLVFVYTPCTGPRNDALRNTYIPLEVNGSI